MHQGVLNSAAALLEESLALYRALKQASLEARLFALATDLREKHQWLRSASDYARCASRIAALRAALGEDAFTAEWAQGRAMSLEDALSLVAHPMTGAATYERADGGSSLLVEPPISQRAPDTCARQCSLLCAS